MHFHYNLEGSTACINFNVLWSSMISLLHFYHKKAHQVCINFGISLRAGSHLRGHSLSSNQLPPIINQPRGKEKEREQRGKRE
eukprot:3322782-Ditylum_brightwellii.AAC.1